VPTPTTINQTIPSFGSGFMVVFPVVSVMSRTMNVQIVVKTNVKNVV
jgi:hypothetical protein